MKPFTPLFLTLSLFQLVHCAPATESANNDPNPCDSHGGHKCECYPNARTPGHTNLVWDDCGLAAGIWQSEYPSFSRRTRGDADYYWLTHNPYTPKPNLIFSPQTRRSGTCEMIIDYLKDDQVAMRVKNLDQWVWNAGWLRLWCEEQGKFGGGKVTEYLGASEVIAEMRPYSSRDDADTKGQGMVGVPLPEGSGGVSVS